MIELTFLGTCSGTEPMPNRHHSCVVMEIGGRYYWFDAGENCSHAAYTSDIDVSRIRAVFISHMHVDHIGGLANLLFTVHKVAKVKKRRHINDNSYDVFVPDLKLFGAVKEIAGFGTRILSGSSGVFPYEHEVKDGVIFEDDAVRVTALHNAHLKETGEDGWHSYSYLIEAEGKRIVYSGDVKTPKELDAYLAKGCDVLIMETGHHSVEDVCGYAKEQKVKKLLLTHHGREILGDVAGAEQRLPSLHSDAKICHDGDRICLS